MIEVIPLCGFTPEQLERLALMRAARLCARNLAIGGALCAAFYRGWTEHSRSRRVWPGDLWWPGCEREAPYTVGWLGVK